MIYDVIVIGGGASGMMSAGTASLLGLKTLLIEKNERLGKKLLITGKGRCNITNSGDTNSFISSYGKNGRFLYRALSEFSNEHLINFFHHLGVKTKLERGGRIFPLSDKSQDIVSALKKYLHENQCEISLNSSVGTITKDGDIFKIKVYPVRDLPSRRAGNGRFTNKDGSFTLSANYMTPNCRQEPAAFSNGASNNIFESKKVIIATGGCSYPLTGSTGDGYSFAKEFGHSITEITPALVPLETKESFVKKLQGLSLKNVLVKAFSEKKEISSEFGEMLFTHFGISGPVILTLSGTIVEELKKGRKVHISINFKPALSREILTKRLLREFESSSNKHLYNVLKSLLPEKLAELFIDLCEIPEKKPVHQITREERERIQNLLTDFRLEITKARGFDEAIITRGGISLNEINPYTMESKKVKGLFFCGEIIDIDGITGGYNLQEAFSTGYLAAKGASKS
ncbi:MAG: NAD(P)/FAD-dependent oxidoreductase [Elusimicrobia bacterium]|nr:NAD(P)/FAD-dependent oxidoreductase [Elusimicrobiota bacterium]